jgi:hypothetical protein
LIVSCKEDHKYLISDDYQNGSDDDDEPSLIKIFDSNLILQGSCFLSASTDVAGAPRLTLPAPPFYFMFF